MMRAQSPEEAPVVVGPDGMVLTGEELEEHCKKNGLCPRCAKTKTHKRAFKLLKKNKWQPLTTTDSSGGYLVYKGFCLGPSCYTLDQARGILEGKKVDKNGLPQMGSKEASSKKISFSQRLKKGLSESKGSTKSSFGSSSSKSPSSRKSADGLLLSPTRIRRDDDDVSVGSSMSTNSSMRRSLTALLKDNAGTVLDLTSVKMEHAHITELVASFKVARTLKTLILENCKLNDNELEIIAKGLFDAPDTPITQFSLRANEIGNRGASSLYDWLSHNETLEEFDISNNSVGSMGAGDILAAFRDNPDSPIRMINFAYNEIWDVDHDGSFFASNTTLQILNLEGNFVHDEGIEAVANGISANDKCALQKLFLGGNGIGDEGFISLAKMFESNTSIETLGLGENHMTNTGARMLLSSLSANETLVEITGLYHNQIDRRFVISAIKNLVSTHRAEQLKKRPGQQHLYGITEEDGSEASLDAGLVEGREEKQDEPTIALDKSIDWADKLFAPGEDAPAPIMEINIGSSSEPESPKPAKAPSKPHQSPTKKKGSQLTFDAMNAEESEMLAPENSTDRLVVFQASPLAYFDQSTSMHHAIPLHDYDFEEQCIDRALQGSSKIGGDIEKLVIPATVNRLKSFLSSPSSRIMHLSTHGRINALALENGMGYIDNMSFDDLKAAIQSSGSVLQVVFVSSFYSRTLGKALVEAGVPHVICCQYAETFRDSAALTFTRYFYRGLSVNKSLKESFEMATEAVRVEETSKNDGRYLLLPEKLSETYHDVKVFFTQNPPPNDFFDDDSTMFLQNIPAIPPHFTGREVDMYEIIEALRGENVVSVSGEKGSGKRSTVTAVTRLLAKRHKYFEFENVFWLPPMKGVVPEEDTLYADLCEATRRMMKSDSAVWEDDEAIECRDRIEIELESGRTMIAIDTREFRSSQASQNLEEFISHLLDVADVKFLLINVATDDNEPEDGDASQSVRLGPISFRSTSLLFGEISRFITATGCPAAQTPEEFATLMVPPSIAKLQDQSTFSSRRRQELLKFMGGGNPVRVILNAKHMPADDFIDMIGVANLPEVQVESHSTLVAEIQRRTHLMKMAVNSKNYMRAQDHKQILAELEDQRSNFPSLDDLLGKEKKLKDDLAAALASKQYDVGNAIKREMLALKREIMHEKRSNPQNRRGPTKATEDQISELKQKMQSMLALAELSNSDMDYNYDNHHEATFVLGTKYHQLSLEIYSASIFDFDPSPEAGAVVSWTNECCDLTVEHSGKEMARHGGEMLVADVDSLPPIANTDWGTVRCGTGNACVLGPGDYHALPVPCVVLAVGPMCGSCEDDCEEDDEDQLHYIEVMMRSCVRSALVLAKHSQLQAIAFPTVTTKLGGETYSLTLQLGLQILVEEAKYSDLSTIHLIASTEDEASKLITMATKMGLKLT